VKKRKGGLYVRRKGCVPKACENTRGGKKGLDWLREQGVHGGGGGGCLGDTSIKNNGFMC